MTADSTLSFDQFENEEELKIGFLVPLLRSLGVNQDELHFETSFRLVVGRQTLIEDTSKALTEKRPRLDILVTRDGQNLFVLEVKRRGQELTEQDRDQAVCYARLVDPMAPYALVSNGDDTRIYRTDTRKEVRQEEARLDTGFQIVIPGSDDFDALDYFLRLSPDNLLRFSQAQVEGNTRALIGSSSDLTKKYIPELHEPRERFGQALSKFRESSRSTLVLVADSGIGKTCSMCHRALQLLDSGHPVLFLRGSELDQRLLAVIADEFAWTFKESLSLPELVRRLSRVVGNSSLLVFVDAIDEWQTETGPQQLGSLAKHLSGSGVKLVLSCKSYTWLSFLKTRGVPTDLALHVEDCDDHPGLVLGGLPEGAFYDALHRYKRVYGFDGVWDESLLEEAKRSPFFMRVAFEVAKDQGLTHITESSREIFERYFENCLEKTRRPDLSRRVLRSLAAAQLAENKDAISSSRLHSHLQLGLTEDLPDELFQFSILERVTEDEEPAVRFAFEGLRNYVHAFQVHCWQGQSLDDFKEAIREPNWDGVQGDALVSYYKLASPEHQRAIDQQLYEPALKFLEAYREIIRTHFPSFSSAFPPGEPEKAGLVLEANLRTKEAFSYGLRIIKDDEPQVLILPTESWSVRSHGLSRVGAGGLTVRLADNWLHEVDPFEELLRVNIARLLTQIVRDGALNEDATPDLARELLAAAVISRPDLLNEPNRGWGQEGLPLPADRLQYWLLLQQHWHRLEGRLIEAKIELGEIPVKLSGTSRSYSRPPLSAKEREQLHEGCNSLIVAGAPPGRPRYSPIDPIADRLKLAIRSLERDDEIIEGPLFPEARESERFSGGAEDDLAGFLDYSCRFMRAFVSNYKRLIESNFPTLKREFRLYSELPVWIRMALWHFPNETPPIGPSIKMWFLTPDGFEIRDSEVEKVEISDLSGSFRGPIEIHGRLFSFLLGTSVGSNDLFGNYKQYPDLGQRAWSTVLRDYTYSWIESELDAPMRVLGAQYGVEDLKPTVTF
jgi:hypothetical protein